MYGYFLQQHIANYDVRNINYTYILLDVLLCSIAEYFYDLFRILVREIQLTDQGQQQTNLSNWSSGVQIPRDICTRLGRFLYSIWCSWIIIYSPP